MNEFNYEGWIGSILDSYASTSEFPAEGSLNTIYIVRDSGTATAYVWDDETSDYIELAGGGGSSSVEEVTLDDLFDYICIAYGESDGKEHTYVIKSDENGDIPTVTAFKTSMVNYLDTEAAKAFIYESGKNVYLTFNLVGQKTIVSGSYNVGSESIPLQVNYEIKTDPNTGDSYIDPHVYSLEVITENNQLKVVPVEATGPISGFVRLRIGS